MENKNTPEITQQQRLQYLIAKYFKTQREFADKSKINVHLIYDYLNNKTKKISTKTLMKIEANIGFSKEFIQKGVGNELIEDSKLKPLIETKIENIFQSKTEQTKTKETETKRGLINKMRLKGWGETEMLTEPSIVNVVDVVVNGLESPIMIEILAPSFYKKYDIKKGTNLIIDETRAKNGDIVLVYYNEQYYICKLRNNELIDTAYVIEKKLNNTMQKLKGLFIQK